MISIDEAIESLKSDYEIDMYIRDIAPQLAEWLEELKEARKGFNENRKAGYKHGYSDGYNKAIDDMEKAILDRLPVVEKDENVSLIGCVADVCIIVGSVAKQLKDGGKND